MIFSAWTLGGKSTASATSGKLRYIALCMFYCLYLIIGAAVFSAIESPNMKIFTERIMDTRMKFLENNPCVDDNELEDFIKYITGVNSRGLSPLRNASNEFNWSFGQALFFSTTIITTIGYGHLTPISAGGKIFCMIYATIGIPLTLLLLNVSVQNLLYPMDASLGFLNSRLGHLYQPFNIRFLHLILMVIVLITIFLTIPAITFAYLEPSWHFLDAFYYCFISLTTIGLGDYIPGDDIEQINRSWYKTGLIIYLILGLIAVMLLLRLIYGIPELNINKLFTENDGNDMEKLRLACSNGPPCYSAGPSGLYMPQQNESSVRSVVRIRPRADDSPSPDDPTPMHARDIRVP